MKKIYALFAVALMSVSMFASLEPVPTAADLSAVYDGINNVVLCCYFDETPCNDVVLAGSYNGWSDNPANCDKFEALEGFDGWYVAEAPYSAGFMAKPLQLKNGGFAGWAYQVGDPDAWENKGGAGTKAITLTVQYEGETQAEFTDGAGYYVYEIKYWKNHKNPCEYIPSHDYTVKLYAPNACAEMKPAIVGDFDSWTGTAMSEGLDDEFKTVYTYSFHDQEGHTFKIKEATDTDWTNELLFYDVEYDKWSKFQNFELGAETEIVLNYGDNNLYRFSKCLPEAFINIYCDNTKGRVTGSGQYNIGSQVTFSAIPNSGYHFVQWNDSVTDNPRTLQLTQDTTFTAFFEIDSFYVSISCDTTKGSVDTINGFYPYGAQLNINATPKYGYHFDRWSDNRYSNPRSLIITSNTYLTAIFAKNSYYVHGITNPDQGTISGTGSFQYEDYCTIQAVPNYGYHFVQWSDSVIENPRSFVLTKDTMFAAEFAVDTMGTCGKYDALNWVYDAGSKTLVISGDGSFDENMRYGVQAKSNMSQLIIQEGVTAIGESAFAESEALTTLSLPTSLKRIGDYAFQNCLDLSVIYNHRETPCVISTNTFDGINIFDCTLLVPAGSLAMYKHEASNWHIFYFIDTFGEDTTSLYTVNYLDKDSINIGNEIVKLHLPQAPEIEGFTFLGWRPVPSIIIDGIIVQAIYQSNTQGNAPAEVTNPYNLVQKLVRNGNVYILTDDNTYTVDGRLVH